MIILVLLLLVGAGVGLYFLNKRMGILGSLFQPRQRTIEQLKADAVALNKIADEMEERSKYAESIRASRERIAKAKAKINPPIKRLP
jgi:hypothetical protein